jgi:hypothetical protein
MDFRHDAAEGEIGGSDGCINLNEPEHNGVEGCLKKFGILEVYDKVKAKVSLADFFVIAGEAASARAATHPKELAARFRDGFKYGRKTVKHCPWNWDRMPSPEHGCFGDDSKGIKGLKHIFNDNMFRGRVDGWALTAAISGAHTVGKASLENSGYEGHWSTAAEQGKFNNDYYKQIFMRGWVPELAMNGKK